MNDTQTKLSPWIGVLAGVIVSGFFLFLYLVFGAAAAGNSGGGAHYVKVFLPIAIVVFVLNIVVALWLCYLKKKRSAIIFAWAPTILLFGLPMLYSFAFMFLSTFGVSGLFHSQGSQSGIAIGKTAASGAPSSVKVELEVLDEKTFDVPKVIKEEHYSSVSKWSEMSWDKVREEQCKKLLKKETEDAPLMQTWLLFVNDPSGKQKVRYTGDMICDPDAIWFLDYVIEKGRTTLTKYTVNGEFVYQLSFENPKEPLGYAGAILIPTFKAGNGYLEFEWWNTNQSGLDRHIKRFLRLRLEEPQRLTNRSTPIPHGGG